MGNKSFSLFGNIRALENKISEFLDQLSECNIIFRSGISAFLEGGGASNDTFKKKQELVIAMESRADSLRRDIETEMFEEALIPDFRADILTLLENLDQIINHFEDTMINFAIENPDFPKEYHAELGKLLESVANCVEALVVSSRAFFRDVNSVRDNSHKVMLFEKEADQLALPLKSKIFASTLPLDQKAHLRNFVNSIDEVADKAEDVTDMLAIVTIRRAA
ncbi:MAG: DUF47 family protein [Magnetococcales bacterium]|nr:DUF47 family protein [Magnetococcales bacterium]MBF0113887.1 DUF47 family protein [Magnetococcales bacterium]